MRSNWQTFGIEDKIRQILISVEALSPSHHFNGGFITAYQLAIEFAKRFPAEAQKLGYSVGGKGLGSYNSLAQYLALQLSKRIKSLKITDIEGAFLANLHLADLIFDYSPPIHSSVLENTSGTSMFRMKVELPEETCLHC